MCFRCVHFVLQLIIKFLVSLDLNIIMITVYSTVPSADSCLLYKNLIVQKKVKNLFQLIKLKQPHHFLLLESPPTCPRVESHSVYSTVRNNLTGFVFCSLFMNMMTYFSSSKYKVILWFSITHPNQCCRQWVAIEGFWASTWTSGSQLQGFDPWWLTRLIW